MKFERVLRGLEKSGGCGGGEDVEGLSDLLRQGNFDNDDGVHGSVKGISTELIERVKRDISIRITDLLRGRRLVIIDGFLLFGRSIPSSLKDLFDIKILLRARYEDAKRRREKRNGYVTLEGFWEDPEGYFDEVVWPNYVGEYERGLLFEEGEGGDEEGWDLGVGCEVGVGGVLGVGRWGSEGGD